MTQGPSTETDPIDSDDTCPGCGAISGVQPQPAPPTVDAWTCTTCGMHWAITVVNPAMSVISALPTPQLRTAPLLAVLRAEVTHRAKEHHPMPDSVCVLSFHLTELVNVDAMATIDAVVWWCRLCDHHTTATTRPAAHTDAMAHPTTEHNATIGVAP